MGKPPYEDADALDLMRADAGQVELLPRTPDRAGPHGESPVPVPVDGFDVPADAVELGELHVYLD
jgi:hypothetical protein